MSKKRVRVIFPFAFLSVLAILVAARWSTGGTPAFAQDDGAGVPLSGPAGSGGALPIDESPPNVEGAPEAMATYRVSGSVFRPRSDDVSYDWGSDGGCIFASGGNDFTIFNAPIALPQGSEILSVRMYYRDANAMTNTVGWFTIYNQFGELVQEWIVSSSGSDQDGDFSETSAINHVIDYDNYSYVLNWRSNELGDDMQLCGFAVYYESPFGVAYAPVIRRP